MGVVSNMPPPYVTGTVSGAAGQAVLTGSGTTWTVADSNGNTVGQVFPGDLVIIPGMAFPNPIQSVDSPTQITLELPLPAAVAGSAYRIRRYAPQPQGAVLGALQSVLNQGMDGTPDVSRTFDGGTGRLKIRPSTSGGVEFAVGSTDTPDASLVPAVRFSTNGTAHFEANSVFASMEVTSNGNGNNLKIGDDAFVGDNNVPYGICVSGQSDRSQGKLQLGGGGAIIGSDAQSGIVSFTNAALSTFAQINCGDIVAKRTDGTGVIFLGSTGKYLYWDGTNYNFQGTVGVVIDHLLSNSYLSINAQARLTSSSSSFNVKTNDNSAFFPITASQFLTGSDYRIKMNSRPLQDAAGMLKAVKVYQGEFSDAPGVLRHYVIAHEVAEVGPPSVVVGTKDAFDAQGEPIYQAVDYTRFIPALIAAHQEQARLIATLTDELASLKAARQGA